MVNLNFIAMGDANSIVADKCNNQIMQTEDPNERELMHDAKMKDSDPRCVVSVPL